MAAHNGESGRLLVDQDRGVFKISRQVFTDPQILEAERRAIFDKCWLYLGHESELAEPNAFLIRSVGGRELLFTRDGEGTYHCFYNSCPHRGARVCREAKGVQTSFQCFYHGWVFRNNGLNRLLPDESYAPSFREDGGADLVKVARLEQYRGLWFINFDPNACSLVEYLAGAAEFIDCIADQSETGLQVHQGQQEYDIRANWKLLLENSYDGYHGKTVHISYFEYVRNLNPEVVHFDNAVSKFHDLGNGHAVLEYNGPWGRPIAKWIPAFGEHRKADFDAKLQRLTERFGKERGERIAFMSRNIGIFPNLVINDIGGITIRTFYPKAVDHMAVSAWGFGAKGEADWELGLRLNNFLEFLGPAGFATADDAEVLEQCQKGFSNNRETLWSDISRGMQKPHPDVDDEGQMRAYWSMWDRTVATALKRKEGEAA